MNRRLLEKIDSEVIDKRTKAKFGGYGIISMSYPHRQKKMYSQLDIQKLVRMKQKEYGNDPRITFMPTLFLDRGYRSCKSITGDEKFTVDLYGNESEYVSHFVIYMWRTKPSTGGCDVSNGYNDCLFKCLLKVITPREMGERWNTPTLFKRRLHLLRDDMVPLSLIPQIENQFKISINITGDHTYTSPHEHTKVCNLKLINEHYIHVHTKTALSKHLTFKRQKLLMCYVDTKTKRVDTYNGEELHNITMDDYYKIKNSYGEYGTIASNSSAIIEEYEKYMEGEKQIRNLSKGKIRPLDMGIKEKDVTLRMFNDLTQGVHPDLINELEEDWLHKSFKGGLIFGEFCEVDQAVVYDLNSAYPNALKSTSFSIPIKEGEFTKLKELGPIVGYGIYRCIISKSDDYNTNKLFRFNPENYYTHIDIASARQLGLDIELIIDDEANALLYKKRIVGSRLFGTYISTLYDLKKKGCTMAKPLLNTLWGGLCERRKKYKSLTGITTHFNIPDNHTILAMSPLKDEDLICYSEQGHYFKTPYARLGPFLTAFVRKQMMTAILPIKDETYRCHTDSILTNSWNTNHIKIGKEIGQFKIEKQGNCIIKNAQTVTWQ
jgi:hypothetical protein